MLSVGRLRLFLASKLRMAVGDDLDYREALLLVLDGFLEYLLALHRVRNRGARYKGRSGASASLQTSKTGSIAPYGAVAAKAPSGVVGEAWPPVIP